MALYKSIDFPCESKFYHSFCGQWLNIGFKPGSHLYLFEDIDRDANQFAIFFKYIGRCALNCAKNKRFPGDAIRS